MYTHICMYVHTATYTRFLRNFLPINMDTEIVLQQQNPTLNGHK